MVLFLITNDDGVNAIGLQELVKAVSSFGNIVVIAPNTQQSGKGKSVTYTKPLRLQPEIYYTKKENINVYSIDGTPADSVIIGQKVCESLYAKQPDLILSGINSGDNTSIHALFTSGTCAAALEGGILGIPSLAFSLEVPDGEMFENSTKSINKFQIAAKYACQIIKHIIDNPLPSELKVLNINFPYTVTMETKKKFVKLCPVKYIDEAIEAKDPRGTTVFWQWGKTRPNLPPNTDSYVLLEEKLITITPISLNLGDRYLEETKTYFSNLD